MRGKREARRKKRRAETTKSIKERVYLAAER